AQKSLQSNLQRIINRLGNVEPEGRIVVDIDSVKDLKESKYNVTLEDGDEIVIPQKPSTVNVVGEVYNPSSYIYTGENTTVKDYLDKSGGITALSSEKNIYVVRADGSVVSNNYVKENYWWKDIHSVQVNVGDTIVVPRKLRFPSYMQDAKDITQILYQTAATVGITLAAY
ncbi:MAG: polysaccharide biosynthesis protein, partial [Flexistipes sinusarabici]